MMIDARRAEKIGAARSATVNRPGIIGRYPVGSDIELIAALRYALERRGWRPEDLEQAAGLMPGAVGALLAGQAEPTGPMLRRICSALVIPRWLFHLTGAVVVGAESYEELQALLEKRQRKLAGNPEGISDTELIVEAVETLLAIGEDIFSVNTEPAGSRRAVTDGLKRLARRAESSGERPAAALIESVAAFVLLGLEDLALRQLQPAIGLLDSARSLLAENQPEVSSRPT